MKKLIFTFHLLLLSASIFALSLYTPDSVPQGGIITVYIGGGNPGAMVSLEKNGAVLLRAKSFEYVLNNRKICLALIGVPTSYETGYYDVTADGGLTKKIRISMKEFAHEDIHLNKTMTSLRKTDTVKRTEQSRSLSDILVTTNIESVYERGNFIKPVEETKITSLFGYRRNYLYNDGTSARSIHMGIDYAAKSGTPVYACGSGKVLFADSRVITGLTVVIEHLPGVYSLYYHLQAINAKEGEMIKTGVKLGEVGSTGLSTGPHLHWEIRVSAVAVQPEATITDGVIDKRFILSIIKRQ